MFIYIYVPEVAPYYIYILCLSETIHKKILLYIYATDPKAILFMFYVYLKLFIKKYYYILCHKSNGCYIIFIQSIQSI